MKLKKKHLYGFGPFQLDVVEKVLFREGQPVPLTPRVYEVLMLLVQNGDHVVTKEDLMLEVWRDSFVEDGNLTQSISVLRKTLGEKPGAPQYIETIPRRGYRFIAPLCEVRDEQDEVIFEERTHATVTIAETESPPEEPIHQAPGRNRLLPAAWPQKLLSPPGIFSVLALIGLVFMLATRGKFWTTSVPAPPPVLIDLHQFRALDGEKIAFARFSTDPSSSKVAFVKSGKNTGIWWKQVKDHLGDEQPILVIEDAWVNESPCWSPDNQEIAYVSQRGHQLGIWKLPYSGGTPTMVKALTEMTTTPGSGRPILKSWSGGKIYYQWNKELWALDEKNGNVENLTTLPETAFYRELTIHSSTGKIAYSEMNASGQGDIWLIEGPGAAPRKMTKDSGETYKANLLWHPRGDRLIYNARREGKPVVLQLQIWNGQVSEVSPGYSQGMIADISTDGSRLLTFLNCDESDLYAFETASQQEKVLTTALGFEGWPEISPDGKTVAFQSIPGDRVAWVPERSSLVAMPVPAIAGTQISKLSPGVYEARWSPDSEKIAFLQLSGNSFSLNLIRGSGGTSKQIVPKGVTDGGYIPRYASNLSQAADFSWAADGDRIVYCLRAEQADNIHVASNLKAVFSGGAVNDTLISNNTDPKIRFENPVWSPPGDQLVWITRTGLPKTDGSQEWTLSVSDLNTVREVPGSKTTKLIRLLGWVSSSEVAIATISDDKMSRGKPTEVTLERISVTDGRKTLISSLDQTYLSSVRLNPNGRNLSYVQSHEGRDNIFILSLDGKTHHQVTANNDPMIYLSSPAWSSDDSVVYFGKQSKRSLLTMIDHYQ